MAELAVGGIEVAIKTRTRPRECSHETSLSVDAAGVERSICETCGHISVRFHYEMSGPVTRDLFARPADDCLQADIPKEEINPFSDEERIGVRRREQPHERLLLTA